MKYNENTQNNEIFYKLLNLSYPNPRKRNCSHTQATNNNTTISGNAYMNHEAKPIPGLSGYKLEINDSELRIKVD